MGTVSSRELKNKTGEVLRRVRRGERVTVTNRGKPVALVVPMSDQVYLDGDADRPCEQAWEDITSTIAETSPRYGSWQEAMDRTRRRR